MKNFHRMNNIGTAKYTVNWHDGEKKHNDDSKFYDIKIFKNKRIMERFVAELKRDGYVEQ